MSAKLNIFAALPQHVSDDEDEIDTKKQAKTGKAVQGKTQDKSGKQVGGNKGDHIKGGKDHHHQKIKGAPEDGSHPQERQSGTGQPAFDKKSAKKGGAGKGNWGNNRDDRRDDKTGEDVEAKPEEPEKPEGITLEEYFNKTKLAQSEPKINEAKAKITSEQLMKEVLQGKATVLTSKNKVEALEKAHPKKKENEDETHHVSVNTQHADLLNFRTGFIDREFREKKFGEEAPRERRERREEKPAEKKEETETKEGETQEAQPETEEKDEKRREGGDRRGNYKGGRGDKRGGSFRGGNKTGGNNNYRKNYQNQPKINFEDDSAFPKLG